MKEKEIIQLRYFLEKSTITGLEDYYMVIYHPNKDERAHLFCPEQILKSIRVFKNRRGNLCLDITMKPPRGCLRGYTIYPETAYAVPKELIEDRNLDELTLLLKVL